MLFILAGKQAEQFGDRIVISVDDPFLERNDGVVGYMNMLGADLGAALGDVAVNFTGLLLD